MSDTPAPSHSMQKALCARAHAGHWLSVFDFVHTALFEPQHGYYTAQKTRVGRSEDADFYTAKSLGAPFGACVNTALKTLVGEAFCKEATLVEIGAEPGQSALPADGFGAYKAIGAGDALALEGPCVVFSNELFDAQAFETLQFTSGRWVRMGISLRDNPLALTPLPTDYPKNPLLDETLKRDFPTLPTNLPEGYRIDLPVGANALLGKICAQPWHGLFVAFDYGKDFAELCAHYHEGTARAYRKHTQHNAIFESAGAQDITHHICWDVLEGILQRHGFEETTTVRQESFLLHHAAQEIERQLTSTENPHARRSLMELLHPTHMGSRFQVLSATRPNA